MSDHQKLVQLIDNLLHLFADDIQQKLISLNFQDVEPKKRSQLSIKCESYSNNPKEFYDTVMQYMDLNQGVNGALTAQIAYNFVDIDTQKQNDIVLLILKLDDALELNKENIVAAVIRFSTFLCLSSFNNIDTQNDLKYAVNVLCNHLPPIKVTKNLDMSGLTVVIDELLLQLKLSNIKKTSMEHNVYRLKSTMKYDKYCEMNSKLNHSEKHPFGHFIEGDIDNEQHIAKLKEFVPRFMVDVAYHDREEINFEQMIQNNLNKMKQGRFFFWGILKENNDENISEMKNENKCEIVACARISGWTPTMCRIGMVYTAERYRGKGYATHLVAALCKKLERKGKVVWLMADKKNVASNKVY